MNLANSKLKELNEEKNKFIGIAAHDLRSPIGGIYSLSDILLSQHNVNLPTIVLEALDNIKSVSSNTLAILNNLLDVSKIESGRIELKMEALDYITLIKHHISFNRLFANNKDIVIHLDSSLESIIAVFDKNYLGEVIDNLLSNAIKYSDPNSEIILKFFLPENGQILTEVIDKGRGIKEEEQQKLFKYFHTTSTKPTDGEKSTGLGLAIAKHIVKLHNGEIGVKSIQDQGSNFYFYLPVAHGKGTI